ncbi:MAG: hypothetical protein KDG57_02740 [Rhodoferax sp.]|nr:hypothetical protein [Rhodoferax sp.]
MVRGIGDAAGHEGLRPVGGPAGPGQYRLGFFRIACAAPRQFREFLLQPQPQGARRALGQRRVGAGQAVAHDALIRVGVVAGTAGQQGARCEFGLPGEVGAHRGV